MNLKHGQNPTLKQIRILQKNHMDSSMWFISKVLPDQLLCIHRLTGEKKSAFLKVNAI